MVYPYLLDCLQRIGDHGEEHRVGFCPRSWEKTSPPSEGSVQTLFNAHGHFVACRETFGASSLIYAPSNYAEAFEDIH